jgi:hypothetical protein
MDILGYGSGVSRNEPEIKTVLCRKAWEMLRAFGDEICHEIQLEPEFHGFDANEELELYESTETEYIKYGEFEDFSVVIDQYPFMKGRMCSDVGYVALHLSRYDRYEEVVEEQQIVFRQEIHPKGADILIGDNNQLDIVGGFKQLIEIGTFLEFVKNIAWQRFIENPFSYINTYPQSDLIRSLHSMLFSEEDNL